MCDRNLPFWERLQILTAPSQGRTQYEEYRDGEPPEDETYWAHSRVLMNA